MDITLAVNPGSSSKKYAFYREGKEVFSVRLEHTEEGFGKCVAVGSVRQKCEPLTAVAYDHGLHESIALAIEAKVFEKREDIKRVGIRIVAPHSFFSTHRVIDMRYKNLLHEIKKVAPLHIPYVLEEITAAEIELPHARLTGVSDSAFHATMPSHASLYSVSDQDREAFQLYRYGYHGLSVAAAVRRVRELHGSVPPRLLVVHVGSGVSITAVKDGVSVDTSMGFAPASGLLMGSRGGDIDAIALTHLMHAKKLSPQDAETYLNTKTGFVGLVGTSDLRIVLDRAKRGDYKAVRSLDVFFYHIHKAMHAYIGVLGGIDAVVLTATAVERNHEVRTRLVSTLSHLGCVLDAGANERLYEREGKISADSSSIAIYTIPTQEMGEIARVAETI